MDIQRFSTLEMYAIDMHIKENIRYLKSRVKECLSIDLDNATAWVLSQEELSDENTLEELCDSYDGIIQVQFLININEETQDKRIDILDVFIPNKDENLSNWENINETLNCDRTKKDSSKWLPSDSFREIQQKYSIPKNPRLWGESDVQKWLQWAKEIFSLENLKLDAVKMDGRTLCSLNLDQFQKLFPNNNHNAFLTHLELLRKSHTVAVLQYPNSGEKSLQTNLQKDGQLSQYSSNKNLQVDATTNTSSSSLSYLQSSVESSSSNELQELHPHISRRRSTDTVSNLPSGTPQLWQFLLELLTNYQYSDVICWCGKNGEFKFLQPEVVAKLWGKQKGKESMNYKHLSRSLRYYYESNEKVINKVNRQSYVYKFEIDLKQILGYDACEIQEQLRFARDNQN